MNVAEAMVVENRALGGRRLIWLRAPAISRAGKPGQFVQVRVGAGLDPFLPRAFWLHRLRDGDEGEEFALLVEAAGRGTGMLTGVVPGMRLTVIGPLGRPAALRPGVRQVLLAGEGIGVAPLVWLADEATARGRDVTLVQAATTEAQLYPPDLLPAEVEIVSVVGEAAGGPDRLIAALDGYVPWADQVIAAVDPSRHRPLAATLQARLWRKSCSVLLTPPMPCGTGLCGGCAVEMRRGGWKLACVDGPVFELRDVV